MDKLSNQLRRAPFIRLLIPFVFGVVTGTSFPSFGTVHLLAIFTGTFLILVLLNKASFKIEIWFGLFLLILLFEAGFILANSRKFIPQELEEKKYFAVLDEYPVEKNKTYKAIIQPIGVEGKILAYFAKTDELEIIRPGTLLYFTGKPERILNPGNPFEFDYQKYMNRRNIGHRIYLKEGSYSILKSERKKSLKYSALILRHKLISILERNSISGETLHVISSISLGARDELEKETLQSFSNTGAIHVLSVSGLHVGIIFVVLNFLFAFLKRRKRGVFIHMIILLFALWFYALITGLSPSVLRATAMFSFVVIGKSINRNSNIYNTLAASAFVLLCIDPVLLYDVGFQLSYLAVFAIVYLQPFFYKQLYFKNYILDKTWICLTVSIAAQIGTLPLSLYYFHQFPTYFWLANLIVILLSTAILYLSFIVFLLTPLLPVAGWFFSQLLKWSTDAMLISVKKIEALPQAVIPNLYPSVITLILCTLTILFLGFFIFRRRSLYLNLTLASVIMMLTFNTIQKWNTLSRQETVIFNIPGKTVIAFTQGTESTFLIDENTKEQDITYYLKPYLGKLGIESKTFIKTSDTLSLSTDYLKISKSFVNFNGMSLGLITTNDEEKINDNSFPNSDLLVVSESRINGFGKTKKDLKKQFILFTNHGFKPGLIKIIPGMELGSRIELKSAIRLIINPITSDKKITTTSVF